MAQEPQPKNTHNLAQSRELLAASALRTLINGWEAADLHIERVAAEWRDLTHEKRRNVAYVSPMLAGVLIDLEDHDAKRRDVEGVDR